MAGRILAPGLLLTALAVGSLRGQEPDSVAAAPDSLVAPTRDTLAAPAPPPPPAPRLSLVLTVGTAGLGEVQSQPVTALRTDLGGAALDTALLRRVLGVDGGLHAGASAILSLTPVWGVRIGAGLTRTSLRARYEGEDDLFVTTVRAVADGEAVDLQVLSLESALRFRLPATRRLRPYLELGAVMTRWRTEAALTGAAGLEDGVTRLGATAALGGVLPLGSAIALRMRATTGTLRTPIDPARGALAVPSSTLDLSFRDPIGPPFADEPRETLRLLRFELGLSVDLGRAGAAPPDRSAPAGSTSPPAR